MTDLLTKLQNVSPILTIASLGAVAGSYLIADQSVRHAVGETSAYCMIAFSHLWDRKENREEKQEYSFDI
jgi:hypothetical protein